jgi:hypothetical protein
MPRVVPSQVRELIEAVFPPESVSSGHGAHLPQDASTQLAAILALLEKLPDDLLTLEGRDYSAYAMAVETIRHQLNRWVQGDHRYMPLVNAKDGRLRNPVLVIYEALKACPDEVPSPTTVALTFVGDTALRASIRSDISAANRDFVNGEWKGATVLAGSATEALLLWALQEAENRNAGAIAAAVAGLVTAKTLAVKPTPNPERWDLSALIEVAVQLKLIRGDTAQQARLAKDFRNLIHPGRAARLKQICDRGTALSALAAVELVARDLTP